MTLWAKSWLTCYAMPPWIWLLSVLDRCYHCTRKHCIYTNDIRDVHKWRHTRKGDIQAGVTIGDVRGSSREGMLSVLGRWYHFVRKQCRYTKDISLYKRMLLVEMTSHVNQSINQWFIIGRVSYLIYVSMRHYVLITSGDIVACFYTAVCLNC